MCFMSSFLWDLSISLLINEVEFDYKILHASMLLSHLHAWSFLDFFLKKKLPSMSFLWIFTIPLGRMMHWIFSPYANINKSETPLHAEVVFWKWRHSELYQPFVHWNSNMIPKTRVRGKRSLLKHTELSLTCILGLKNKIDHRNVNKMQGWHRLTR